MWSRARGGGVAVQTVGVAGAPTFSAIAVDGGLQLTRRAQALLLTLERVQILHVPSHQHFMSHFLFLILSSSYLSAYLSDASCADSQL